MMNSVDFSDPDQAATALQAMMMTALLLLMMVMSMLMMMMMIRFFHKWWVEVKRQQRHFQTFSQRQLFPPLVCFHTNTRTRFYFFHCRRKFHWRGTRCVKYVHGDLPFICVVTGLLLMLIILIPLHLRFQLTRLIHSFLHHYMANQGLPRLWNPNY